MDSRIPEGWTAEQIRRLSESLDEEGWQQHEDAALLDKPELGGIDPAVARAVVAFRRAKVLLVTNEDFAAVSVPGLDICKSEDKSVFGERYDGLIVACPVETGWLTEVMCRLRPGAFVLMAYGSADEERRRIVEWLREVVDVEEPSHLLSDANTDHSWGTDAAVLDAGLLADAIERGEHEAPRHVGMVIRDERVAQRISLRQLAERLGITDLELANIERGKEPLRFALVPALCEALPGITDKLDAVPAGRSGR